MSYERSVSASDAVVVDPSGDATELRLLLARLGASCAAILVTHGHWDHLVGVAELATGTGAPVYMAEGERDAPGGARPILAAQSSGCSRTHRTSSCAAASRSSSPV